MRALAVCFLFALAAGWLPAPWGHSAWAAPQVVAGELALANRDFAAEGPVALDGAWRFAPGLLLAPGEPWPADAGWLQVPGHWNQQLPGGHGVGTYGLTVHCHGEAPLAISLPFAHSAQALYANGRLLAQQGQVGPAATHRPEVAARVASLDGLACPLQLLVQVSNHELARGGLVRSLHLGTGDQLADRRVRHLLPTVLALGGVAVVGLFALLFSLWRRQERSSLLLAVFCGSFAASLGLGGDPLLQSWLAGLGFDGQMRLLHASWFLGMGSAPLMLRSMFPRQTPAPGVQAIAGYAAAGLLLALVAPPAVLGRAGVLLHAGAALTGLFLGWSMLRALRDGERGAWFMVTGLGLLLAAVAHDALLFSRPAGMQLLPFGVMAFVLGVALMQGRRFVRALAREELQLIEQRERTDLLVRATNAGLLDWNAVDGSVRHSERYKEMLGYPADAPDASLPPLRALIHPDDVDAVVARFVAQLREREVRGGVQHHPPWNFRLLRADGGELWVQAEGMSIRDRQGRALRYVCSFLDISARVRHEQEMADRVQFINDLVDAMPLGVSMRDPEGRFVFANRSWERYYGRPRAEVIGFTARETFAPEVADRIEELDRQARRGGPDHPFTADYPYGDRQYTQTSNLLVNARGDVVGVVVATQDVTERHAVEQALAAEQRRFELVVRAARVGIVDWDGVRRTGWYSPLLREILGHPPDADTSGWPDWFDLVHPEDREALRASFRRHVTTRRPGGGLTYHERAEYRVRHADGRWLWVEGLGVSQSDAAGYTVQFITSVSDITERRAQQEALRISRDRVAAQAAQLERQNEALKENVRLREEVERIGRHDLKTPLASIVAVPRLLREEPGLGPQARELLDLVERAGYRLQALVNLSLDLYKMEQGSYLLRPQPVDLRDLARKVMADVHLHAASKQVALRLDAPPELPPAWGEELLCYSLLANLLKNAVEASPEGQPVVVALRAQGGRIELRIHNAGVVPPQMRNRFFRKYATAGKAGGTGLGSYSARLMARVQGGDVAMASSQEEGTTLTVRLPQAPVGAVVANPGEAGPEQAGPPALAALPPMRVLVVDDDEYHLLIVRRLLPSPPFTVETAVNGRAALAQARAAWPQLLLMDLDMPVMGGLEAVARLRALEQERGAEGGRCHMVALSSHDDAATRQQALAAGFDRYLVKPVSREALQRLLAEGPLALHAPMGDPQLEALLPAFVQSRRELLQDLLRAGASDDRAAVRRLAHQLAGSFALYGLTAAGERSHWLEANAERVTLAQVQAVVAEIGAHLDVVLQRRNA